MQCVVRKFKCGTIIIVIDLCSSSSSSSTSRASHRQASLHSNAAATSHPNAVVLRKSMRRQQTAQQALLPVMLANQTSGMLQLLRHMRSRGTPCLLMSRWMPAQRILPRFQGPSQKFWREATIAEAARMTLDGWSCEVSIRDFRAARATQPQIQFAHQNYK